MALMLILAADQTIEQASWQGTQFPSIKSALDSLLACGIAWIL
jgi:hypothetical protein